ncbi:glycoside hydrolase family 16 protein [Flavihumibacter sp. UBA7668]|uniref:glycoside hydrolase family 16 protein n=1 Tax=Flavihumibacter sp. UBA7668 TaxID=1946542 RepID=UPI0025B82326|nr:glycoside hydrolase family 16 protein [Flavihumibacter sp. UBA7668]
MKNLLHLFLTSATILLLTGLISCRSSQTVSATDSRFKNLIWSDEFSQPSLDTTKWTRISANQADWGRHMTKEDKVFGWENGILILKGIRNPDTSKDKRPFLTGGIYTKDKFSWTYGRIDIRAKLEEAQGAWPAFWMLGANTVHGKYPRNGEIDIMEHLSFEDSIYQTVHSYYTLELNEKKNPPHYGKAAINRNEFNVFSLEWTPEFLAFKLNGKETFRYPRLAGVDPSQWPFDQPFYLLLDQQLGGSWVGKVNAEQLPVNIYVDWVRIYQ